MVRSLAFVLVAALTILVGCGPAAALHGTTLQTPRPAPPFTLEDQNGRPLTLESLRGHVVAVFFGFTHCTDVCPETFERLNRAAREVASAKPVVAMITVDPRRDSLTALRTFVLRHGGAGFALTGSQRELRSAYRAYGIAIEPRQGDIGHTDTVFVIDSSGRLRELLDPQTPVNAIAADLRALAT